MFSVLDRQNTVESDGKNAHCTEYSSAFIVMIVPYEPCPFSTPLFELYPVNFLAVVFPLSALKSSSVADDRIPLYSPPRNVYKVVHAESKALPFLFLILTPNLNPIAICTPESALNAAVEKGDI